MFDRMIFKGHLMALYKQDGARCFLWSQGVPLTNFTDYAKGTTERIANNARKLATDAGRPVISFDHVKTRNRVQQKDDLAKNIAARDAITEGILALTFCAVVDARRERLNGLGPPDRASGATQADGGWLALSPHENRRSVALAGHSEQAPANLADDSIGALRRRTCN